MPGEAGRQRAHGGRGVLHLRCDACGEDTVVLQEPGFCPSCGGRRLSELAARLVDRILPNVPVRLWVLTLPVPIRYQLAFDASLTRAVLRVLLCTLFGWLRRTAARQGVEFLSASAGRGGPVSPWLRMDGSRTR